MQWWSLHSQLVSVLFYLPISWFHIQLMTSAVVVDNVHACFVCHKGHALYACLHFDLGIDVTTSCVVGASSLSQSHPWPATIVRHAKLVHAVAKHDSSHLCVICPPFSSPPPFHQDLIVFG